LVGGGGNLDDAANRMGLPADLVEESEGFAHSGSEVYPDNAPAVSVFIDMLTQWRTGPGGVAGLDYGALRMVYWVRKIKPADREDVFERLQIMEKAALVAIREKD